MAELSAMATTGATPADSAARLGRLRAQPRKPGEASFFWYETHFRSEAVKVLPGEYFVSREDMLIMTTLGSCIAACLWDRDAQRRRHEPLHAARRRGGADSGRYGSFAMELLINELLKRGATRTHAGGQGLRRRPGDRRHEHA